MPPSPRSLPIFRAADLPARALRGRDHTVSVCVPVRDEAGTIGPIVETLAAMRADELLDQVVVVDAASTDGSAAIAASRGAEVFDQSSLMAEYGPVMGKGDAIWRSLSVLTGEILCFFDGDLAGFSPDYVNGLAGVLLSDTTISFAKAAFSRPFRDESGETTGEGGRVTDAMARPMLELFYPALCAFQQPLSGQFAASRELLASLPMSTGYGIDIGLLIDVHARIGLAGMAEVDIGVLYNAHQTLEELEPMSYQVGLALVERLESEGRFAPTERSLYELWAGETDDVEALDLAIETRPPFGTLGTTPAPLNSR
jgi:glucosyl-3-phosphoglycerate synthase